MKCIEVKRTCECGKNEGKAPCPEWMWVWGGSHSRNRNVRNPGICILLQLRERRNELQIFGRIHFALSRSSLISTKQRVHFVARPPVFFSVRNLLCLDWMLCFCSFLGVGRKEGGLTLKKANRGFCQEKEEKSIVTWRWVCGSAEIPCLKK